MKIRHNLQLFAVLSSFVALPAAAESVEWSIDAAHTRIGFSVNHMVVSEVDGEFKKATGKVYLDEADLTKSSVELEIDAASIDTGNADRDAHLRNGDFFEVDKHPTITFKSKQIKKAGKAYKVTGDLSIRGVTKSVTLDIEITPAVTNPWGKQVRGVKVKGKINRQDFGVAWSTALDKGGLVVDNEVRFNIKVELNK